ncbi:MAG: HAD hydrolase family protein [Nitrospinae bacterium]|nr:HAD hydrolase family protein [Nitrospinota bacterium]
MLTEEEYRRRLAAIRFVALDVDGTLTDGGIIYTADGVELKVFDVKDGLGIARGKKRGLLFAFITGRPSEITRRRGEELGIDRIAMGPHDKGEVLTRLAAELEVTLAETLFMGDDLIDLPAMRVAGLAVAVADAHPTALAAAHRVTRAPGGKGAVRETLDALFAAKGWA